MGWDHLSDGDRLSRKERRCIWCFETIQKGAHYHFCNGKMDDEFQSNQYHPECWHAAQDYFRSGEDTFGPGEFKRGSTAEKGSR